MRRFECPHCNYVNIFAPDGKSKHKKTFVGFSCPRCHKKVTEDDIRRNKGSGPKPPGERRKRSKKEEVKETPIIVAHQPYVEQFEWRTRGPPPPGYGGRAGWRPKPRQPTERTLEEAVVEAFLSNPKRKRKE